MRSYPNDRENKQQVNKTGSVRVPVAKDRNECGSTTVSPISFAYSLLKNRFDFGCTQAERKGFLPWEIA